MAMRGDTLTVAAPQCYCLCVLTGGEWVRVITVWGVDLLGAYDEAVAKLPEHLRYSPAMLRISHLCPPAGGACSCC